MLEHPATDIESFWIIACVLSFALMVFNAVETVLRNDVMDNIEQIKRVLGALGLGSFALYTVVMLTT